MQFNFRIAAGVVLYLCMLQPLCGFPPMLPCFLLPHNSLMTLPMAGTLTSSNHKQHFTPKTKLLMATRQQHGWVMYTLHGITLCQQTLTQDQIVLSSLHENLLHLLRALGCCSGFLQRHRQLIRLLDCGQHVLLLPASGLIKAWEHISQGAWLPGNAASASLQRYPATLQACIAQNMVLDQTTAAAMLHMTCCSEPAATQA